MAIASSGAVSASDIRSEYGLTGAVSFSSLYRGGTHVRAKAANNTGTNLAASVPTSGAIAFDNFRGTAKGFRYTYASGATDQDASALFGSDYAVNYPKEIVINSGVELGATSTTEEALEIDSGGAGSITVTNNGTLSGAGGSVGADGGDAFEAAVTCTFVNNGTVRAGGGGGGTGGNGSYTSYSYYGGTGGGLPSWVYNCHVGCSARFGSGPWTCVGFCGQSECGSCRKTVTNSSTGGAGGVGAGYNQSAGTGTSGSNNSGTGGDGGAFGASGSTGTNGNSTNGVAGGAGGKYLRGSSFVTFTNNGTAQGGTAQCRVVVVGRLMMDAIQCQQMKDTVSANHVSGFVHQLSNAKNVGALCQLKQS